MTDPEFNLLLDYMHDSYSGGGPDHFLLTLSENATPTVQKRFFEDFKIKTICYDNNSGNHSEVRDYIEILKTKI